MTNQTHSNPQNYKPPNVSMPWSFLDMTILKGPSDDRQSWPISSANKICHLLCKTRPTLSATKIVRFYCPTRTRSVLDEKIAQLICSYVPKYADQLTLNRCTTSKLLTCQATNGGPIRSAFYVVSQSKNKSNIKGSASLSSAIFLSSLS